MTREENENVILMLCTQYPKTFFENPRQRRPLKKNIEADLYKDGFAVAPEAVKDALSWYKNHIGYDYALSVVGAKRVDLTGKEVGTVTETEANVAKQNISEKGKLIADRQQRSPVRLLHANDQVSDDIVKKQDAPMLQTTTNIAAKAAVQIAPEFASLFDTMNVANAAVVGIADQAMRLAVAKATLAEIAKKVAQVESNLTKGGEPAA